jgi:cytoskeletal protein CcmA (bactofilin family)
MASGASVIGPETRIRGRITGSHDIDVRGHIEGELTISGDVRVDAAATIAADVRGRRIVVRGAIKGDLAADEAIALEEGARVVGDLRAPRVAIAPGGLVRGYVETGHAGEGHRPKAADHHAKKAAPAHHAPTAKAAVHKPAAKPTVSKTAKGGMTLAGGTRSGARGKAPAPVVPVLKKGTKAALTKKR